MSATVQTHLDASKIASSDKFQIHEFRKSIDALIQWSLELKNTKGKLYGREMSLVHTKLQEAKMWAGKCLEALGSALPPEYQDKAQTNL